MIDLLHPDTNREFPSLLATVDDSAVGEHETLSQNPDDDPLNMILKLGIRLKCASFAPYGKRLEALAVDRNGSGEKANIRNNVKRALFANRALSPSKFCQYGDNWQFDAAFILKCQPYSAGYRRTDLVYTHSQE